MLVCKTFLYSVLCNSTCLYATLFYILHLQPSFLRMQHFSPFSICQNCTDLFVCNTLLQYKPIKLFSICLYATLFYILHLQPSFLWMQHFSSFSICQNSPDLFVCNTFLQYKLIKLFSICLYATLFYILFLQTLFVWMQHFSSFSICQNSPDLFVCNNLLQYKPIKLFSTCLYAPLFYILFLQTLFVWMQHFSSSFSIC